MIFQGKTDAKNSGAALWSGIQHCQGDSHMLITSTTLWHLLQFETWNSRRSHCWEHQQKKWGQVWSKAIAIYQQGEPTFRGIYSLWVTLMSLLHSTCNIWYQHPCANPLFWGESFYPKGVYILILLSLYMECQQLHRGEIWVFQMSLKQLWTLPSLCLLW